MSPGCLAAAMLEARAFKHELASGPARLPGHQPAEPPQGGTPGRGLLMAGSKDKRPGSPQDNALAVTRRAPGPHAAARRRADHPGSPPAWPNDPA